MHEKKKVRKEKCIQWFGVEPCGIINEIVRDVRSVCTNLLFYCIQYWSERMFYAETYLGLEWR